MTTQNDTGDDACLDFTAEFDPVDHSILLARSQNLVGIGGSALEWFWAYLADRPFSFSVGSSESQPAPLSSGVPQGSILGPLLFSLDLLPKCYFLPLLCR